MNTETLLDPLVTVAVYIALATIAAVGLLAAHAFFKALRSLKDAESRRRPPGFRQDSRNTPRSRREAITT